MKTHLVTFYSTNHEDVFKPGALQLENSYTQGGFDSFKCYTEKDIILTEKQLEFLRNNERGFGFWAWKPVVVLSRLNEVEDGDIVVYHDCGRAFYNYKFTENIKPLVDKVINEHGGVGVAFGHWHHKEYTKTECFNVMGCTDSYYKDSHQAVATWHIWKKQPISFEILHTWKIWNFHHSEIITDKGADKKDQPAGYHGHRHDQSILTNIILKVSKVSKTIKPILQTSSFWEKNINTWIIKSKPAI